MVWSLRRIVWCFFDVCASEKNGQLNFYAILTLGSSFYQGDVLVGKSTYLVHTFRLRAKQYHGMATPGFGSHCWCGWRVSHCLSSCDLWYSCIFAPIVVVLFVLNSPFQSWYIFRILNVCFSAYVPWSCEDDQCVTWGVNSRFSFHYFFAEGHTPIDTVVQLDMESMELKKILHLV